jgi:hypothetical protein
VQPAVPDTFADPTYSIGVVICVGKYQGVKSNPLSVGDARFSLNLLAVDAN